MNEKKVEKTSKNKAYTAKYIKDEKVSLISIDLEMNRFENDVIDKVRFVTSVGDVTWKPVTLKEEKVGGFNKRSMKKMLIKEVPDNLRELGEKLLEAGKLDMKICFGTYDRDSEEGSDSKQYLFIKSAKEFDSWSII